MTLRKGSVAGRGPVPKKGPPPSVRSCRECGCTDERACVGGCSWVDIDLCSACG